MTPPSFPPSFASFPQLDQPPESPSRLLDASGHPSRREKRKKQKHKDKGENDKEPAKSRPNHDHSELAASVDLDRLTGEDDSWRYFYSDRKGDILNVQYGGLHPGDVPKYHLVNEGGRSILGLSGAWMASRRGGKGIEIELRGYRKLPALTDPHALSFLTTTTTRRLMVATDTHKYEEIDGFLPLPPHKIHDNHRAYRFYTRSSPSSDSEMDRGMEEDSDDESTPMSSHQAAIKSFEQQLSLDPSSIRVWLSLLEQTLSTIPLLSKNATKARAEIATSVLSRAISADPSNKKSKILRIKYLKAGEDVWQEDRLQDEWEDALKVGGVEIWMEWLEWRIRRSRNGIDDFIRDSIRAINALGSDVSAEFGKVRILWRVVMVLNSAGYTERGMGVFQAQAELTFKTPTTHLNRSFGSILDALEDFWDTELPRVGEPNAQGWGTWFESPYKMTDTIASRPQAPAFQVDLDPYRQWALNETIADRKPPLPIRSVDESDESDPYSTVLFADVRPLLFSMQSHEAKHAFRLAWLSFLGLSFPGFHSILSQCHEDDHEINWDDRWCYAHITSPTYLNSIFPDVQEVRYLATDAVAGALVGREKEYTSGFGPIKNWGYDVLDPLHGIIERHKGRGSKTNEGKYKMWEKADLEGLHDDIIRRIFSQLRVGNDDLEWDKFCLTFEASFGVKSALKVSRKMLSNAQDSLLRWMLHAQLERLRGQTDDSRKIYRTVLIASNVDAMQTGVSQMWWDWAEMEWLAGRNEDAIRIISHSAGIEGSGGAAILRTKRNLDDVSQACKKKGTWRDYKAWIQLRSLLELLSTADPGTAALLYDHYLSQGKGSVEHEGMTVASLLLLYYHSAILGNPMPPSLLRGRVASALEIYPSNSIILGLFLEGEKGQGVWGRVRAILGESGGKAKDVARRMQEVWIAGWEKGRWVNEMERTRSGLAVAVEHERTRASPVIWRIYIEFEIRANELHRAKKLLYRAIGECPLAKEIYLLAFNKLRSVFGNQELRNIVETMAERGIRMRQGVDEIVEGWTMDVEEKGEDNEEGTHGTMDEIEENARERRRLIPY
ncbi:hypothetical protein AMATHDRAFT_134942 [Amanita thiersii Skay4041]|uniref:DUF1740-domain-containing protein n=1 Tax=Amanita thiersii Skay4041 TaxID=703135 RepID=A0A2A9P116_9AGAR|nr:hypothetical protein AMATHDRAFT_134942 [Amanita thiersii Skay4041]